MTTTAHGSPLMLPGQVAAPRGPVDMSLMYVMHHGFRRDLADFVAAVPRTPVEERDTWKALQVRWARFADILHEHHTVEDDHLWPAMEDRADPEEQLTLAAMEDEHAAIDPGLRHCQAAFARLAEHADGEARAALAQHLAALQEALHRHLAHEEADAIAIIQRRFTAEEYAEVDKQMSASLTLGLLWRIVPWAMHRMPDDAARRVLADAPPGYRLLWWLSRPRFLREDRRAFAHLR